MNAQVLTSTPTRAAHTLTQPLYPPPPGACDCHVHVFGPEQRYPHVTTPHYTLPDGELTKLLEMARAMRLDRFVIVQPSFYGTDNRCLLDALSAAGPQARGVAMVQEEIPDHELQRMHALRVRALRLDLFQRAQLKTAEIIAFIERSVQRARPFGWHIQFYTPGWVVRDLLPFLATLDADFVIDHMGYMLESDGLTHADFERLVRVVHDGRGWIKLSAPYRLAKDGNFAPLLPRAQALIAAAPSRMIWGSDWPHIPDGNRDTGTYLNLLADWAPDAEVRKRILVDNPARLFGFEG